MPSKHLITETTDLKTGAKSYKIFQRTVEIGSPIATFQTRAEAEERLRELEAEVKQ